MDTQSAEWRRRRKTWRYKRGEWVHKQSRPTALSTTRPRSLTPPLHDHDHGDDADSAHHRQVASRFWTQLTLKVQKYRRAVHEPPPFGLLLSLPLEVRLCIWRHVLGGRLLHIVWLRKKLCAVSCTELDSLKTGLEVHEENCWILSPFYLPYSPEPYLHEKHRLPHRAKPVNFVPLLRTCRAIYSEFIDILYKETTFDFNCAESAIFFTRAVLPRRLAQIRRVNITWMELFDYFSQYVPRDPKLYHELCAALQKLSGLSQLIVRLGMVGRATSEETRRMLELLGQCRASQQFDLIMEWTRARCDNFGSPHRDVFQTRSILDYDLARLGYTERSIAYVDNPRNWWAWLPDD
ncbi:hypothetical protein PWT90_00427 [Aphanocladium album]|nr:hypothetical protein PWT90_00427 [Aphanocladium album]